MFGGPQCKNGSVSPPTMEILQLDISWLCSTVLERRSMTVELSLSYARPAADG